MLHLSDKGGSFKNMEMTKYHKIPSGSHNGSHGTEAFRVYFSASDTSIGTAVITVTYRITKESELWYRTALIVSISCALFVLSMLCIIRCRKQKPSALDLAADSRFLSIASAHHDISGTNHRGTSYVIGSFDSAPSRRSKRPSRVSRVSHRNHRYQSNDNTVNGMGHLHTSECYAKDSECYQRITSSGTSTSSGSSCSCSSSTDSESDPNTSSSSYCPHCHGKYANESGQEHSESVRLSQISFPMIDALDDTSPSMNLIHNDHGKISGITPPKSNKWSLANQSLGERLIGRE